MSSSNHPSGNMNSYSMMHHHSFISPMRAGIGANASMAAAVPINRRRTGAEQLSNSPYIANYRATADVNIALFMVVSYLDAWIRA